LLVYIAIFSVAIVPTMEIKKEHIKILILEDTVDDIEIIEHVLKQSGLNYELFQADSKKTFVYGLQEFKPDIILSDHSLPQFNSINAFKICEDKKLNIPFILVTGAVSEEFAVSCLKHGIDDYILKSNLSRLPIAILNAINQRALKQKEIQSMIELTAQNKHILKINQELDSFIYSISHSLRGPISTISGLLNLIELDNKQASLPELHGMMGICVNRLNTTIEQMVDQTKNSRLEVDVVEIDIQKAIEQSIHKSYSLSTFNQIEIQIDYTYSGPFYSDPYRVEVILNSLLLNAIKYADLKKSQPSIHIKASHIKNILSLTITDNGIGIDPKNMPNIYNMFYRASEKSDGSGLGLYLAKEFTEKLKGSIHIESINHKGTTVKISLPNLYKL
jgi:signal transduction histidine kinase